MKRFTLALAGLVFASTVLAATPDQGGGYGSNVFRNCARTPVCAVIYSASLDKSSTGSNIPVEIKYLNPGQEYSFKDRHFAVGAVNSAELCENGRPCKCSYIPIPSQGSCMTSPPTSEVVQVGNTAADGHGNRNLLLKCNNR